MFKTVGGILFWLCLVACAVWAQEPSSARWTIVVVGRESLTLSNLRSAVTSSLRNQALSAEVSALEYDPKSKFFGQLGIRPDQLPIIALGRLDDRGQVVKLVGYPELAETGRSLSTPQQAEAAAERVTKRYRELTVVASTDLLEIRGTSLQAATPQPLLCGTQIAVSVQTSPTATVDVFDQADPSKVVSLMESGPGLYQGNWTLTELQKGSTTLVARVRRQGQQAEKVVGSYQTLGWAPPRFLSVNPSGPDLYTVAGMAPPFSQVEVRCHVDMGRFLFIGYPDYDNNWTLSADKDGKFSFVMDLSQGGTRRDDIVLTAQFEATANDIHSGRRSEMSEFSANVRMFSYPFCGGGCSPRCSYCLRYR